MYNIYGNIRPKEAFENQGGVDKFVRWRVQLMYVSPLFLLPSPLPLNFYRTGRRQF